MQVHFSFQHTDPSDAMKERAQTLSTRLKKYFEGKITIDWHFTREKSACVVHCHVTGNHIDTFAEASDPGENFYAAMDECFEKVERQIRKHKETVTNHHHREEN
ncbi:MAG: ribosome-associated translation inhibitor RaiA [Bdellovibrionales bacterium]|nr:ribosome-associated translation inhibitor RaiA [Bdellovibrionales bacterium]